MDDKDKRDAIKNIDFDFMTHTFSPPCVILAEFIATYYVFKDHIANGNRPETFISIIFLLGEVLFAMVVVLFGVLAIMIVASIVAGGIGIGLKYFTIIIDIIAFISFFVFGFKYL